MRNIKLQISYIETAWFIITIGGGYGRGFRLNIVFRLGKA